MANYDKTRCPLCNKEVTFHGFHKHLTSQGHHEAVAAALRLLPVADQSAALKGYRLPVARLKGKEFSICFGCPKAYHCSLQTEHLKSCKHRERHLEKLRAILEPPAAEGSEAEDPLPEGGGPTVGELRLQKRVQELEALLAAKPVAGGGDEVSKLRKELEEAETYIKTLEEELEEKNKQLAGEKKEEEWNPLEEELKSKDEYIRALEAEMARLRKAPAAPAPPAAAAPPPPTPPLPAAVQPAPSALDQVFHGVQLLSLIHI
jgi:hypothetical protein